MSLDWKDINEKYQRMGYFLPTKTENRRFRQKENFEKLSSAELDSILKQMMPIKQKIISKQIVIPKGESNRFKQRLKIVSDTLEEKLMKKYSSLPVQDKDELAKELVTIRKHSKNETKVRNTILKSRFPLILLLLMGIFMFTVEGFFPKSALMDKRAFIPAPPIDTSVAEKHLKLLGKFLMKVYLTDLNNRVPQMAEYFGNVNPFDLKSPIRGERVKRMIFP